MAKVEKRFIRVEDWQGNVYVPELAGKAETGGGGGTIIIEKPIPIPTPTPDPEIPDPEIPDPKPGDPGITEGESVVDPEANGGTAIIITSGSKRKILLLTKIANVPFGEISINMRIKSSRAKYAEGTEENPDRIPLQEINLLEVNTYYTDDSGVAPIDYPLNTCTFTNHHFNRPNYYTNLSMTTDYHGMNTGNYYLKIRIDVLPDTNTTFYFDRLTLSTRMQTPSIPEQEGESEGKDYQAKIYVEGTTVIVP